MHDWMISKKRYWGLALPIYDCAACGHFEVIGSEMELQERAVEGWDEFEGHSPHRPWVDAVKIALRQVRRACRAHPGRRQPLARRRHRAVLDPALPRRPRRTGSKWFPADFVTESFPGQFRNWFYSLLVMSTVLEDTAPFETVLGFATCATRTATRCTRARATHPVRGGRRQMGVDVMRWLFTRKRPRTTCASSHRLRAGARARRARRGCRRASTICGCRLARLDKLWNVYSFFVTYANIDRFNPDDAHASRAAERSDLDRWVLSELQAAGAQVSPSGWRTSTRSRRRGHRGVRRGSLELVRAPQPPPLLEGGEDGDKLAAYLTLYECLVTLTKLLAPFMPFLAEELYQNLVRSVDAHAAESVHLSDWPAVTRRCSTPRLPDETALVMRLVILGRAAREQAQMRVRQPLASSSSPRRPRSRESARAAGAQVLDELNVKRLELLPRDSDMLTYTLKPRRWRRWGRSMASGSRRCWRRPGGGSAGGRAGATRARAA